MLSYNKQGATISLKTKPVCREVLQWTSKHRLKNKGLVTRSIEAYRIPIALGVLLLSLNGIPVQRKLPPTVFQYQVLPSRKRHGGSTVSYP